MKLIISFLLSAFCFAHEHGGGEGGAPVGAGKGITAADEQLGFSLSEEARARFGLETLSLRGKGPWKIPRAAVLHAGEEVNLFRLRAGAYRRVDFISRGAGEEIEVSGPDLREGDAIAVRGVGYLRITEIAAFGGKSEESHGH